MKYKEIQCGKHYMATHRMLTYQGTLEKNIFMPESERVERVTVSLPFHEKLRVEDLKKIILRTKEYGL
jgi:dTDP-4-amino-4,6-dideoxygalactose transaminase